MHENIYSEQIGIVFIITIELFSLTPHTQYFVLNSNHFLEFSENRINEIIIKIPDNNTKCVIGELKAQTCYLSNYNTFIGTYKLN